MPKIVVLDGATLTDGVDPTWEGFYRLGECKVYARTSPDERLLRLDGAQAAITNKCVLDAETLQALPRLRYVGLLSTGCNAVDVQAAQRQGIVVSNIPAYSTESVVQALFGLLIEVAHGIGEHADAVRAGAWQQAQDFCFYRPDMLELANRTMGVVGYGKIGRRVAQVALAFGMQVAVYVHGRKEEDPHIHFCSTLEELLGMSDVVSLNCPLNDDTFHMINAETLAMMRPGAILLNTARGALVEEEALAEALRTGKLFGAGLDVLEQEPPRRSSPLIGLPRVVITPHIGWATPQARRRAMRIACENLAAFLNGTPQNRVN